MRSLALILMLAAAAQAVIIPIERTVSWQNNVGVNGGIPARATISTTLSAGSSLATVQAALNAAAASNVVVLSPGTYSFAGNLDWQGVANGVVLRGTTNALGHATNTQISFSSGHILWRGSDPYDLAKFVNRVNLSADAAAGATTVTIASNPGWLVTNKLYVIDQLADSAFVSLGGLEDTTTANTECRWCNQLSEDRTAGQMVKVLTVAGSGPYTVNLELPLIYSWRTAKTAQLMSGAYDTTTVTPKEGWGIEDVQIEATYSSTGTPIVEADTIQNSWLKNVWSTNSPGGMHSLWYWSYRISVVDSLFNGSHSLAAGQGYGTGFNYGSAYCLCQNNIYIGLHLAMSSSYAGGANVFGYNFIKGDGTDANLFAGLGTHGSHTMMNLWEGNYSEDKVFFDCIHGSSSHQTLLRNYIIGTHQLGSGVSYAMGNDVYNRSNNIVGNIFGDKANMTVKEHQFPGGADFTVMYLGYTSSSSLSLDSLGHDNDTIGAWIRHGNLFLFNGTSSLDWDGTIADQVIPNSYYLSAKPSWFGDRPWPPFDTNSVAQSCYTNLPAGYRYAFGTNPPAGLTTDRGARVRRIRIRG